MTLEEKIIEWLDKRKETLFAECKEHDKNKTQNTKAASYDLGALDELRYVRESLEEIFEEAQK